MFLARWVVAMDDEWGGENLKFLKAFGLVQCQSWGYFRSNFFGMVFFWEDQQKDSERLAK